MEGSLFPLPQDDMTMDVDICGHVTTRQWNLFATTWQFAKLGALLRHSWWNLLSWNVGWWYSRGASTWSLLPYRKILKTEGIRLIKFLQLFKVPFLAIGVCIISVLWCNGRTRQPSIVSTVRWRSWALRWRSPGPSGTPRSKTVNASFCKPLNTLLPNHWLRYVRPIYIFLYLQQKPSNLHDFWQKSPSVYSLTQIRWAINVRSTADW